MNEIKVGNAKMFAVTIPVNCELDEIYEPEEQCEELGTRVQLLQIEKYWLVIFESCFEYECVQHFQCFISRADALRYLSLLGFELDEPNEL